MNENLKKSPRVSVGLPVYNGEKYLTEAIKSIIAQSFEDFELIISDNDSTDGTEEICRALSKKDKRIRYYRNKTNLGAAKNYNCLVELSTGEYFKWASHDDVCAPSFLQRCVEVLDQAPSRVVLCYPKTTLVDDDGTELEKYDDMMDIRFKEPEDRLHHVLQNLKLCNLVFGLIRVSSLKSTCLIGKYVNSDRVLLVELALLGEFWEIPDYLFFRRVHPEMSRLANCSFEQVADWFDPSNRGRFVMPKCRLFLEYIRSIKKSPLTWQDKSNCYSVLMNTWFKRYWRHLGSECKVALRRWFGLSR